MKIAVVIVTMTFVGSACAGEIYKCPNAGGKVEFRDRPCDGVPGQKLDVRPSNSGAPTSLEDVRAQAAAITARLKARQDADGTQPKPQPTPRESGPIRAEQAHKDSGDMAQGVRDSGKAQAAANDNANVVRQPEQKIKVEIVNPPSTPTPKALPGV